MIACPLRYTHLDYAQAKEPRQAMGLLALGTDADLVEGLTIEKDKFYAGLGDLRPGKRVLDKVRK